MATAKLEDIAAAIVHQARKLGAAECDVTITTRNAVETSVRLGQVEKLEGAQMRGLQFRALCGAKGTKTASSSTSDFGAKALKQLVKDTIATAEASEEDPYAGLPEPGDLAREYPDLGLFDPAVEKIPVETKISLAKEAEEVARGADPRITNSEGASFSDSAGQIVHANSRGFLGSYHGSHVSLSVGVVASQDDEMQVGGWWASNRSFDKLESAPAIGLKAAERALRQLGSRKVKSQEVPVVFDPLMAARLIAQFIGAAAGSHIYRKSSFLVDKLGQVVASQGVNIIDDPLMAGRLGSHPFDSEGLPARTRTIIEEGRLVTYLLSSYAARRLHTRPNSGSLGNLYLQAGKESPEEIIGSVKNGLYLTSVSGPGFKVITGDYSLGASGIWIEDGKLAYPVSGITIASDMLSMFAGIEAIGNDLVFRSSTASPTIKIGKMTVAGQ
ncbi:MAG TPA: TldD/PmbA family protein [Candidatus Obscuribacter sp.]|nr:TldD/PmbA family protein [Candidatus Obscuribacter sp.]HND05645.1 TldD/PmbA family protein [Candidatus Obscuribacter sp.]HNG72969.1 TldD/PmbA family protein [Candidatus Obscuribacter sp.]HNM49398.1 TldD/PmbA family protein [Candidatus Obscuribacter sp.]